MLVKVADVIKDLRTNVAFAILLAAAWILSSVSYENAIRMREQTRDLAAFLLLRDLVQPLAGEESVWSPREGKASKVCREIVVNRSEAGVCEDIAITAPWDATLTSKVTIVRHTNRQLEEYIYTLNFDNPFLPFDRYVIGIANGKVGVLQNLAFVGPRNVMDNMLLKDRTHQLNRSPRYWSQLSVVLNSLGSTATNIDDVKISDPSVGKLITDYLSVQMVRESIAGLSVPIFLIPAGLSVLLLMTCMLLVGDWAALRQARRDPPREEFGWVMLHAGSSKPLRVIALVASCILALALLTVPGVALERTLELLRNPLAHQSVLVSLAIALVFIEIILVATIVEQLRLRHAMLARTAGNAVAASLS